MLGCFSVFFSYNTHGTQARISLRSWWLQLDNNGDNDCLVLAIGVFSYSELPDWFCRQYKPAYLANLLSSEKAIDRANFSEYTPQHKQDRFLEYWLNIDIQVAQRLNRQWLLSKSLINFFKTTNFFWLEHPKQYLQSPDGLFPNR